MAAPFDRSSLDTLVEIGRRKGGLNVHDLRLALPLDSMDPGDVALALLYLDEAGVTVRLDPRLFEAHPELKRWHIGKGEEPVTRLRPVVESRFQNPRVAPETQENARPPRSMPSADWIVATSAAVVCGLYVSAHLAGLV